MYNITWPTNPFRTSVLDWTLVLIVVGSIVIYMVS